MPKLIGFQLKMLKFGEIVKYLPKHAITMQLWWEFSNLYLMNIYFYADIQMLIKVERKILLRSQFWNFGIKFC